MWNVVILFEDMLSIEYYDLKGVLFTQSNLKYFKGNINKKIVMKINKKPKMQN